LKDRDRELGKTQLGRDRERSAWESFLQQSHDGDGALYVRIGSKVVTRDGERSLWENHCVIIVQEIKNSRVCQFNSGTRDEIFFSLRVFRNFEFVRREDEGFFFDTWEKIIFVFYDKFFL
jgi:hypothetical protein